MNKRHHFPQHCENSLKRIGVVIQSEKREVIPDEAIIVEIEAGGDL